MNQNQIGQLLHFYLDGRVEGEGTLTTQTTDGRIVVKLTKPCKDFSKGQEIIISPDEVVKPTAENLIDEAIHDGALYYYESDQGSDPVKIERLQHAAEKSRQALLNYVNNLCQDYVNKVSNSRVDASVGAYLNH